MNAPIVTSYARAQIAKAISHLNFAMSHAGRSAWLDMEACIGSHQDRVEETLKHRNLEYSEQETATAEAVEHLAAAWSTENAAASEPVPALVWAVFKIYRDGDHNQTFEFVGVAASEAGALKLANASGTVISLSRFEYGDRNDCEYLIEAVRVEP